MNDVRSYMPRPLRLLDFPATSRAPQRLRSEIRCDNGWRMWCDGDFIVPVWIYVLISSLCNLSRNGLGANADGVMAHGGISNLNKCSRSDRKRNICSTSLVSFAWCDAAKLFIRGCVNTAPWLERSGKQGSRDLSQRIKHVGEFKLWSKKGKLCLDKSSS